MRPLNYYVIGEDPLPIVGLEIGYYDKHTSFGMFQSMDAQSGIVSMYGGEVFSDDEVNIDEEGVDEWGEAVAKTLFVGDDETQLRRGMIWCYLHEFYAVVDPELFPFQTHEELEIAVKHGIVQVLSEETEDLVDKQGTAYKNKVVHVKYNDRLLDIKFYSFKKASVTADADAWYFSRYKESSTEGWGY